MPQVCLLDIGLPGMDGNELPRQLRKLPGMVDAALAAVTGYGRPQDKETAFAAGFATISSNRWIRKNCLRGSAR